MPEKPPLPTATRTSKPGELRHGRSWQSGNWQNDPRATIAPWFNAGLHRPHDGDHGFFLPLLAAGLRGGRGPEPAGFSDSRSRVRFRQSRFAGAVPGGVAGDFAW